MRKPNISAICASAGSSFLLLILRIIKKLPEVWRVSVKQLQSRQQCLPELFLHILKPYDRIKQTDKSVFVGVSDGNY